MTSFHALNSYIKNHIFVAVFETTENQVIP